MFAGHRIGIWEGIQEEVNACAEIIVWISITRQQSSEKTQGAAVETGHTEGALCLRRVDSRQQKLWKSSQQIIAMLEFSFGKTVLHIARRNGCR